MQYHRLGSTDLNVSRIGLGLAALGRPGYINLGHAQDLQSVDQKAMEQQTYGVLSTAYQQGIRYIDVARSYGRAELFLSNWLAYFAPRDITISSKWGYTYTANWQVKTKEHEVKEHSREVLEKQFDESRNMLGHHLCLYQIHSATLESGVLDNQDVLNKLFEIKARGIRIGLSLSGARQPKTLERALQIGRGDTRLFDTVQATYNLLETSTGKMLELAHKEGMGTIIKEALANGRLTERNQSVNFADKRLRLRRYAEHYSATLDAFALAFVLQQPWVDTVLSGASTSQQLLSNLKALDVPTMLDIEDFSESPESYWRERARLEWN